MILLLHHTGLRISDVATMKPDRVTRDGRVLLRTLKTGIPVYLPLPGEVLELLDRLACSRPGSTAGFFWSGNGSRRAAIGSAQRTLLRVFRLSGVSGAHPHRFRHTLATELLAAGGTMADVADVLGITEAVARRHYAKWAPARQRRIDELLRKVPGETTRLVVVGGRGA